MAASKDFEWGADREDRSERAERPGHAVGRLSYACVVCQIIPLRRERIWRRADGEYACREHAGDEAVPAFPAGRPSLRGGG